MNRRIKLILIRSKVCPEGGINHMASVRDLDYARYCPVCGKALVVRKCNKCNSEMDLDWIYCTKCGKGDSERIQKKMLEKLNQ
jgi:predicted RNA-binding Zn-ribbon protein involved in translation (DUF1610 family)